MPPRTRTGSRGGRANGAAAEPGPSTTQQAGPSGSRLPSATSLPPYQLSQSSSIALPMSPGARRPTNLRHGSLLHSAIIPPGSPLHEQAATSTVSICPRPSVSPSHTRPSSSTPARAGRLISSTPRGALGGEASFTPGDPLGLRKRAGRKPTRPSSLGSFMSLPGQDIEGRQLVTDDSVQMEIEAAAAAATGTGAESLEGSIIENGSVMDDDGGDGEGLDMEDWTLIDRMRIWRDDARAQHLYDTAAFWGYKLFALTSNPNDAFWLAQIYFITSQYARAEKVLMGVRKVPTNAVPGALPSGRPAKDEASLLDVFLSSTPPSHSASAAPPSRAGPANQLPPSLAPAGNKVGIRMTDHSTACRYLAAQCLIRQAKWSEALDLLGDANPFRLPSARVKPPIGVRHGAGGTGEAAADGGIKFEASMCHLRGLVHLQNKANDRAKECFMEALALDVKCFESFEALVGGCMMTPEEEWEFINTLSYSTHLNHPSDASLLRSLYLSRLSKSTSHLPEILGSLKSLKEEFPAMGEDPDVLYGVASWLFNVWRWGDCYRITSRILALHDHHAPTLPLHLTCMHYMPHMQPALFLLAHELIEKDTDAPIGWYAAGLWYYGQKRWDECRRFFSKAAMLDTRFAPAWFGFGHSLALEGEHDQAITAYSTAQHHFQGTHLPMLFIGMQHTLLANTNLAQEYLDAAFAMCKDDPLLLNERGVVLYYQQEYRLAASNFKQVLDISKTVQSIPSIWAATHLNLSHCFRKLKFYGAAVENAEKALALQPRSSAIITALGMAHHAQDHVQEAVLYYHESLAILPADPITTELLHNALERSSQLSTAVSSGGSFRYPGLPLAVAHTLDKEVDVDDEETMAYQQPIKLAGLGGGNIPREEAESAGEESDDGQGGAAESSGVQGYHEDESSAMMEE